ncbi:MAG: glycerophosphodiester phosphodiesterase [Myxococcales bacterium]|nr:glycerophosphodiester phosphodiesterase [Myxococcales bacterium]
MSSKHPDLIVLGHRGDPRHENTLRGLRECLAVGLDGAEIDVQVIADGTVVLFHDDDLERIASDSRNVAELTRDDLDKLEIFGEDLPTLELLLREWPADRWLNVELKAGGPALLDAALPLLAGREHIILSSFDPQMLTAARDRGCAHELALILDPRSPGWLHADGGLSLGCGAVHLHASLLAAPTLARYRGMGLKVGFWGAFDRQHESQLVALGVDRVITDFVADSWLL